MKTSFSSDYINSKVPAVMENLGGESYRGKRYIFQNVIEEVLEWC